MDRRDLDLCDGDCRLCPSSVAGFARSFETIPRRRPHRFVVSSLVLPYRQSHGAGRRRPALSSSCASNGATGRAGGFFGFFKCRRRPALFSPFRSRRRPIGLRSGSMSATHWASCCSRVAVFGESTADRQVARFGGDPKNKSKICDVGLWGFSRHPNYFFEWLVWVAFAIIAIAPGWPLSLGLVRPCGARSHVRAACPCVGYPAVGGSHASVAGRRLPSLSGACERILARAAEVPQPRPSRSGAPS